MAPHSCSFLRDNNTRTITAAVNPTKTVTHSIMKIVSITTAMTVTRGTTERNPNQFTFYCHTYTKNKAQQSKKPGCLKTIGPKW